MQQNFIGSKPRLDFWVIIALASLMVVLFYLIVSFLTFRVGFPLDDAWIHLTYARNLAEHGEWAFQVGERSAGSTSPLWTALLSIGFLINLAPYVWTYLLGWVVLSLVGIFAEHFTRRLVPAYQARIPWAGLFFVFAWHLSWSAVSGMETLLHGLIILLVLGALHTGSRRYLALGMLTGLSVWVRPDGLTLIGPILLVAVLSERTGHLRGEAILKTLIGFGSLILPYVLFNLALSGNPMPNTFYAKQAEYQSYWMSKSILDRVLDYLGPILASPFVVLIPAAVGWLAKRIRAHDWGTLASLLWVTGYIAVYFISLPAYQHGRYIIPAFPIVYLWGIAGFLEFVYSARSNRRIVFIWQALTVALCLVFAWIGARQNAADVLWVESEIVATAKWVDQNIPADARLAVHDIGALGYHVDNPIVDLAGLINPDVIPFIRDEAQLAQYLNSKSVDYLITFPSFYPELTAQREVVPRSGLEETPQHSGETMHIYQWK
ncbi:MAG TPA: hypothetical protein VGK56_16885 [Anaerolineales bacterium]